MSAKEITMSPIGYVRSAATEEDLQTRRANVECDVIIDPRYEAGLDGVEGYSHLIVLFWLDGVEPEMRARLVAGKPRRGSMPRTGVFASRGRTRPNPIGLAVVELIGRSRNVLTVRALDALDQSPVLDIKPYDFIDVKEDIRVPDWWRGVHPLRSPPRHGRRSPGGAGKRTRGPGSRESKRL